ncbi:MAG: restriction endonuclease subunit S [Solobacterium sp.]|nr:restriction endonuclease subunit S [Solobacterium sp.]
MIVFIYLFYNTSYNLHYEQIGKEVRCIEDELPFEIPNGWECIRLDNLGIYKKGPFGSALTKSMFVPRSDESVKVYEQKNAIQKNWKLGEYYITKKYFLEKMQSFTVKPGDIIVSCAGTIGETYIMPSDIEIGIINQALMKMTISETIKIDYFLLVFNNIIKTVSTNNSKGSAIKNIPPFSILKQIIVPIPPKEEQKRIINKIKELEPLIEKYKQTEEHLYALNSNIKEQLKKSILQYAIEGKLVPQDPNDEPASVLLERIYKEKQKLITEGKIKKDKNESIIYRRDNSYYEKLGTIEKCINEEVNTDLPNSWVYLRLGEACNIINGFTPLRTKQEYWSNPTIPWFTIDDIHLQGRKIYKTKQSINTCALRNNSNRILPKDTVLLCCTASVGEYAIAKIELTTNQQFNGLVIKPEYKLFINSTYLFTLTSSFENALIKMAGKTTFNFISVKKLSSLLIPIPSLKEQMYIANLIEKINYILE